MVIELLYPHVCNLYGDRGNVVFLKKCLTDATFVETGVNDVPYFVNNDVNLVYLGPSSETAQELFVSRLLPYKERINELIENGTFFLLTGNAFEVFGKEVKDVDGSGFKGLGLLDITSKRDKMNRKNSIYSGKYGDIEVVGFQSQFTVATTNEKPLFKTNFGLGFNEGSNFEGVRKNNVFATFLIGPLLVLNPYFTKQFFKELGLGDVKLYLEEDAIEAYNLRVEDFLRAAKIQKLI